MPLAHIAEACGGRATDGVREILDIVPTGRRDRLPVFLGSAADVAELVSYGEVQQSDETPVGLASLQRMLALTDKSWAMMRRNVPQVDAYVRGPAAASGWASLTKLQAYLGLSDRELKAAVQRLPQLLGYDFDSDVSPPLRCLQEELALDRPQLKTLVTKLPQMLGLDFGEAILPKLEAMRMVERDGQAPRRLSNAELKAKLLAKPSALDIEVRGGFKPRGGT